VLLEFFWWGSVFLIGVPVMGLLLVLGPRTLPEYRDPNAGRLHFMSAAASLLAILGVVYGLKQIAQDGISAVPVLSIIVGLALGFAFVRHQLSLESPIIDVRLFRIRAFSASLGAYFLGIFVVVGYFLFIAQYLQLVLALSPINAALWSLPSAAGFVVGSTIAPRIIHRFRPAVVMGTGMLIAAAGTTMLLGLSVDGGGSLLLIAAASVVISLGLAPVITLATELIVGSAPPEQAGAATGISETSGELGGALGIAILGTVGTALYRAEVADSLPSGIPAQAAAVARDTLGGAIAIAQELPEALGGAVAAAAQTAFVDAIHLVAAVAAVGALVTAIAAALALRRVPARSEPAAGEATAEPAGAD
jgi:DHA2 family multidrug resistance protein-like MFS transporter